MKTLLKLILLGIGAMTLSFISVDLPFGTTFLFPMVVAHTVAVGIFIVGWRNAIKIVAAVVIIGSVAFGIYEIVLQSEYRRVESLTSQYGTEMLPAIAKRENKIGNWGSHVYTGTLDYIKVFEVISDSAKVFVATDFVSVEANGDTMNDRFNSFYFLKQQNGNWEIDPAKPVDGIWEMRGNSDRTVWPPYR